MGWNYKLRFWKCGFENEKTIVVYNTQEAVQKKHTL